MNGNDPSEERSKIWVWYPGSGRVEPLAYRGWWVRYPKPGLSRMVPDPPSGTVPEFAKGKVVRLRGKPEKERRVLAVEWHRHRYEFVYVVETSAPSGFYPYWFGERLELVPPSSA